MYYGIVLGRKWRTSSSSGILESKILVSGAERYGTKILVSGMEQDGAKITEISVTVT